MRTRLIWWKNEDGITWAQFGNFIAEPGTCRFCNDTTTWVEHGEDDDTGFCEKCQEEKAIQIIESGMTGMKLIKDGVTNG